MMVIDGCKVLAFWKMLAIYPSKSGIEWQLFLLRVSPKNVGTLSPRTSPKDVIDRYAASSSQLHDFLTEKL